MIRAVEWNSAFTLRRREPYGWKANHYFPPGRCTAVISPTAHGRVWPITTTAWAAWSRGGRCLVPPPAQSLARRIQKPCCVLARCDGRKVVGMARRVVAWLGK